jgi:predicted nucleotidyltransferase
MGFKIEQYRDIMIPIILKYLPDVKIILYGSRTRCDERASSNIDIALDTGYVIDEDTMSYILTDMKESALPIAFNVLDFNAVSAKMQETMLEDAVTWYK